MKKDAAQGADLGRFIGKIVAARSTPADEVPELVATLGTAFGRLLQGTLDDEAAKPVEAVAEPAAEHTPAPRQAARPRLRRAARPVEPVVVAEPVPTPAPPPRLMRRAELAPAPSAVPEILQPSGEAPRKGVVRWFDPRTGRGMMRVPGCHDDLEIPAELMRAAGINRLFKGQEVEVTVGGSNGSTRIVALALPRVETAPGGFLNPGMARRRAKPVVVEMKRDALRRAGARFEAEHVLGTARTDRGND